MRAEKIALSFIALLIGLAAAGIIFYFYQSSRATSNEEVAGKSVVPTEQKAVVEEKLLISKPQDGTVIDTNKITISGTTTPDALVIIRNETSEEVGTSNADGTFTMTVSLNKGVNPIQVLSINPDGSEEAKLITITNTNEDF